MVKNKKNLQTGFGEKCFYAEILKKVKKKIVKTGDRTRAVRLWVHLLNHSAIPAVYKCVCTYYDNQ